MTAVAHHGPGTDAPHICPVKLISRIYQVKFIVLGLFMVNLYWYNNSASDFDLIIPFSGICNDALEEHRFHLMRK